MLAERGTSNANANFKLLEVERVIYFEGYNMLSRYTMNDFCSFPLVAGLGGVAATATVGSNSMRAARNRLQP